jgi:membrane-bound serine protease (ClpP class)
MVLLVLLALPFWGFGQAETAPVVQDYFFPQDSLLFHPIVAVALVALLLGGFGLELKAPGLSIPGAIGLLAATALFIPRMENGMAESWEVLLFFGGVTLLVLEVYVIPGTGLAGVSGLAAVLGGLLLVLVPNDGLDFTHVEWDGIVQAASHVLAALVVAIVLIVWLGKYLIDSGKAHPLIDLNTLDKSAGFTAQAPELQALVGQIGVAETVFRPVGFLQFDDRRYEGTLRAGVANPGDQLRVVGLEANTLVVERVE